MRAEIFTASASDNVSAFELCYVLSASSGLFLLSQGGEFN